VHIESKCEEGIKLKHFVTKIQASKQQVLVLKWLKGIS